MAMGIFSVFLSLFISVFIPQAASAASITDLLRACQQYLTLPQLQAQTERGEFILSPVLDFQKKINRTRLALVMDNGMMNWNHADVYEVVVTPLEFQKYSQFFSRRVRARLKVTRHPDRGFIIGSRVDYDATIVGDLVAVNVINPSPVELEQMPEDTAVSVEGKVISIQNSTLLIETERGQFIRAGVLRRTPRHHMVLDPSREDRRGEPVQVGDVVRVLGLVYNHQIIFSAEHSVTLM